MKAITSFTSASALLKFTVFGGLLILIRLVKTHHFAFLFLPWNLFLAWLPYYFISRYNPMANAFKSIGLLLLCLLFLPNAPYIITDLFHLTKQLVVPQWFDLVMILCFSVCGLLLFLKTTEKFFIAVAPFCSTSLQFNGIKWLVFLLNGYGIYVGRYLRFNSWDLVTNPYGLAHDMFYSVFGANNYKETLAVTVTFSVFLYLMVEMHHSLKRKAGQHELF